MVFFDGRGTSHTPRSRPTTKSPRTTSASFKGVPFASTTVTSTLTDAAFNKTECVKGPSTNSAAPKRTRSLYTSRPSETTSSAYSRPGSTSQSFIFRSSTLIRASARTSPVESRTFTFTRHARIVTTRDVLRLGSRVTEEGVSWR